MNKNISILGVQRASQFSPNHIGNDSTIFRMTTECLKEKGFNITIFSEQEFLLSKNRFPYVFTMLRSESCIHKLQQQEKQKTIAINSAFGIENCGRERMTSLLIENNVSHPKSLIVETKAYIGSLLKEENIDNCWLKRADFHAIHREDVCYARHAEEVQDLMSEFSIRGIDRVVINKHIKGDLIKFYGVKNSPFFYWFYPFNLSHSKFGLEAINGTAKGIPFSLEELKHQCELASEALNIQIYGGDCIVDEDCNIKIIDFNDWPSYAPCRKEATIAIANCIEKTCLKNEME